MMVCYDGLCNIFVTNRKEYAAATRRVTRTFGGLY